MTDDCKATVGPNHPDPNTDNVPAGCVKLPGSNTVCPTPSRVTTENFQLTQNGDACYIDGLVAESMDIGAADINVYKLLGVHEQCKTVDATGMGLPISNGDAPGHPALNAFTILTNMWKSIQTGPGVLASAFIGYDFGEIKTRPGLTRRYGNNASVFKHITAFAIKQSSNQANRATRARVERSENGTKWYGVGIVNLPDDDCLNTILFKDSVPSRYWRIRPVEFNGGTTDPWVVQALEMYHNYIATDVYNIQDKVFLENRDREYSKDVITLKGSYDLLDTQSELSRFGIEVPSQSFYLTVNFSRCVELLGRPLIVGDIIEMPSEAQYSAKMERIQKWMEVTDVAWSTEGYTPGWQPTLLRIILQPAYATQETQDIFGDMAETQLDDTGLFDGYGDGFREYIQDYSDVSQTIKAEAKEDVPQRGIEFNSTVRAFEQEEVDAFQQQAGSDAKSLQSIGLAPTSLYVEDAMPPNNAPFTEGPDLPTSGNNGDYHRLTYEGLSKDVPARLYRYSGAKNRWIWLETDRRSQYDGVEPTLQEYLTSPTRRPSSQAILRDEQKDCDEE